MWVMAKKQSSSRPMWSLGTNSGSCAIVLQASAVRGRQADRLAADAVGVFDGQQHVLAVAAAADADQHVALQAKFFNCSTKTTS